MKEKLAQYKLMFNEYIASLGIYDYLGLGAVVLVFLLLFLFSILLRKRFILATIIGFIGVFILLFGPFVSKYVLDMTVRASTIEELVVKKLQFTDGMLITGKIKNIGKITFDECTIKVKVTLVSKNYFKNLKYQFKPYKHYNYDREVNIEPNGLEDFRILVDDFKTDKEYTTEVTSKCKGKNENIKLF